MKNANLNIRITFITGWMMVSCLSMFGQMQMDLTSASASNSSTMNSWLANLYEIGVGVKGDSIMISDEARQIAANADLRKIIYPETYTMQNAKALLVEMQVKVGVWYMINLYRESDENKNTVLQYVLAIDKQVDMERVLLSSFYTYIFFDPQAGSMVNGKPDIQHPEIMENKLAVIREISAYIQASRKQS